MAPHENRIEDSLRRPWMVSSSLGPQASKNLTSCLRAASSFQSRLLAHDVEEMVERLFAPPGGIERDREIEARLVIVGVGLDARG